jgi:hypothetical protein
MWAQNWDNWRHDQGNIPNHDRRFRSLRGGVNGPRAADIGFDFEGDTEMTVPSGFETGMTGNWKATEWSVREVAGNRALAHIGFWNEGPDGVFPVCWVTNWKARDLTLTVRLFPVQPPTEVPNAVHDGAGIVLRFTDPDNYYLLRAVPLETRVRFYKVEHGKRSTLAGRDLEVTVDQWLLARCSLTDQIPDHHVAGRDADTRLEAHLWVSVRGTMVVQRRPGNRGRWAGGAETGAWCAVLACLTPRMYVTATRPGPRTWVQPLNSRRIAASFCGGIRGRPTCLTYALARAAPPLKGTGVYRHGQGLAAAVWLALILLKNSKSGVVGYA